jgi:glycosyltransferase involved in cell wall biosynthesis
MKVSVVIPAYNEEKYIGKCLQSVINQKVSPDEIIVVNNNSKDKTVEIAKKFGIRIINEKKQGMIPTRNRGFNNAKYDIIARIDSDVLVPIDWIKRIKNNFEKGKIDALSGPISYYDSRIIPKSSTPSKIYLESLRMFSNGKNYLVGPNMSLTNELWQKIKDKIDFGDSQVHEDIDLSLKIHKHGGIIGYDSLLVVRSSARRMVNHPESFFIEYPKRFVKTFWLNQADLFPDFPKFKLPKI